MKKLLTSFLILSVLLMVGSVSAATITVPGDYATIQAAINAAVAGDTISVGAGTYTENINVNKNVTIIGVGATTIINPAIDQSGFIVTADGAKIQNLKIILATSGVDAQAIRLQGADDVIISGTTIETTGNKSLGIWIGGVGYSNSNNLQIIGNTITITDESTGIYAEGGSSAQTGWKIQSNTITANKGNPLELYDVTNSEVSDNALTTTASGGSNVMWFSELSNLANLVFKDNILSGSSGSEVAIGNDFRGDSLINGNTLDPDNTVVTSITSVTITGNTFSNWGSRALRLGKVNGVGTTTGVNVNNNKFLSAGEALRNIDASEVDATLNYWSTAVPNFITIIVGNVDSDPWYANSEMTDLRTEGNVGGEGSDFISLTVPDSIAYGNLYSTPGFETASKQITLTNTGSLAVSVTPVWSSGAEIFQRIKFSDDNSAYGKISGGIGTESNYSKTITAVLTSSSPVTFSNPINVWTKIKIATGDIVGKLKGTQSGTIYFQAVEQ